MHGQDKDHKLEPLAVGRRHCLVYLQNKLIFVMCSEGKSEWYAASLILIFSAQIAVKSEMIFLKKKQPTTHVVDF